MKTFALASLAIALAAASSANAQDLPNRNTWLTDSVYPISHDNPAATDSVAHAGPTKGRKLGAADVKSVPTVFTSNPTVKKEGDQTIVIAAGIDGIRKINATGERYDLVSVLPYPGLEAYNAKASPEAIQALLEETDAARRAGDDGKLLALSKKVEALGFERRFVPNGVYNMIDKDGNHYAAFGGLQILKSTDDNDPQKPLRVVKSQNFASALPAELQKSAIVGMGMTYDGHIAAAAHGALMLVDRDLNLMGTLLFPGEAVENSICIDEKGGIYVVTSKRMLKVVWTGTKLSYDEADGGWETEYNTMSPEQAASMGALTRSGGSGTTPTLMGFGNDPDKLVVISDGDSKGANLVAFWRDEIPAGFKQKPGTKSARIADQIPLEISKATVEPSPAVLGYGVALLNNTYEKAAADIWGNAMTAGVTRPAPKGVVKFDWDTSSKSFKKSWVNTEVDNTDVMVPVISAKSDMIYLASKQNGDYEYVGLDWKTGKQKASWQFPDDSRKWNAWGGITALLEDGDLLIGGLFATKRVNVGGDQ
ncbi:hypothetical protein [Pseudomonas schmalbachii]|uniref:Uncharacterized protein n=1 Tax=Pseudomonas schmalbachii TaxID=2816993 RepID=A0ABS3TW34_9PSED|nr:hypothetical protein [Pseudomonas schmalbachii]MBO3276870.1 hypothetical protein [Pseudomonas schmalbachii]